MRLDFVSLAFFAISTQVQVGVSRGEPFNQRVITGSEVLGIKST
jgi:hypothetical protein